MAKKKKKWIQKAIKRKGALHKALGVKQGKKIPKSKITKAATKKGRVGVEARLAEKLATFNKKKKKKRRKKK